MNHSKDLIPRITYLFLFLLSFSLSGLSQTKPHFLKGTRPMISSLERRSVYNLSPTPPEAVNSLYNYYKAIGLQASGHWVNSPFLSLSATYHSMELGEGGGRVIGGSLGVEAYLDEEIFAPKADLWIHGFAFFLGGNLRLSGVLLNNDDQTNFILRPEIGLGLIRFYVYYGYNLFLNDSFSQIGRHTLTMSFLLDVFRFND